jgi:hypothetical protein
LHPKCFNYKVGQGTYQESLTKKTIVMKTFNLNGIELLSTRELAAVKGGGEEGVPTPIIIVEEGNGSPASANAVETLTALFITVPAKTATPKKKR